MVHGQSSSRQAPENGGPGFIAMIAHLGFVIIASPIDVVNSTERRKDLMVALS